MIIETSQQRLLIVSDLHVGNPFSRASKALISFFDYAERERFNVCINGDGFEILQTSFASLANDSVGILNRIRGLIDSGLQVFYVVGNHDIVLEHFLTSWSKIEITPFLNVTSGNTRIRVEHGHLYDPSFVQSPRFYEFVTRLAGPLLHLYPDVYRVWTAYENLKQGLRNWRHRGLVQSSVYYEAADMLARRGFDVVVFGHTHTPEDVVLGEARRYINSGNWVRGGSYVEIQNGRIELRRWTRGAPGAKLASVRLETPPQSLDSSA